MVAAGKEPNTVEESAALLQTLRVARPCPARWEDMVGDDRVRFCSSCSRDVYNFSALTSAEAAALLRSQSGKVCGLLYRRRDGTLLTADCPVGQRRFRARLRRRVLSGLAGFILAFGGRFLTPAEKESLIRQQQSTTGTHPRLSIEAEQLQLLGSLGYISPKK